MSVIIHKDEYSTIIATVNKKYTINQSRGRGIELLIGPIRTSDKISDDLTIRIWIPEGTKASKDVVENATEISVYPIPLKVIEDIQERTNGDIEVEDVSEYYEESGPGREFFSRIKGYIIMATL